MSTLTLWSNPFADFDALVRRAFGVQPAAERRGGFAPVAEVTRDGDDAVIALELPNLDVSRDVTVEVEHGKLVVRGERRDERSDDRNGVTLREVRYGSFRRSFALPEHVAADAVSADYDAGVLTVRVTGAYSGSTARRIPVTGGAARAIPADTATDEPGETTAE